MSKLKILSVLTIAMFLMISPMAIVGVHAQTQTESTNDYSTAPDNLQEIHNNLAGEGTQDEPYIITNIYELQAINQDMTAHYELGNNIDASSTSKWNPDNTYGYGDYNEGFEPIGSESNQFVGVIDGNGYEIQNLHIEKPSGYRSVGFVEYLGNNAKIKDVVLTDANIIGGEKVGGLVGQVSNTNSNISDSYISGTVKISGYRNADVRYVGGLVGHNEGGKIENSISEADVTGTKTTGGLVGFNEYGQITYSYATGKIESDPSIYAGDTSLENGGEEVGGLVGLNNAEIKKSYSENENVIGTKSVGGLVGFNSGGSIQNSYSQSPTEANSDVGGLVGYHFEGDISKSYATGYVNGQDSGALLGVFSSGSIDNLYYDSESTGESEVSSNQTSAPSDLYSLTTSEMQGENATENMSALDFDNIWKTQEQDYPTLQNMPVYQEQTTGGTTPEEPEYPILGILIPLLFLLIVVYILYRGIKKQLNKIGSRIR